MKHLFFDLQIVAQLVAPRDSALALEDSDYFWIEPENECWKFIMLHKTKKLHVGYCSVKRKPS